MIEPRDLTNRAAETRWLRRRGRPRLFEGEVERVRVRIPVSLYDALDRQARRTDRSVPDIIRELLLDRLPVDEFRG